MIIYSLIRKLSLIRTTPALNCIRRTLKKEIFHEYKFGSPERVALVDALQQLASIETGVPVPLVIGIEEIFTGDEQIQYMPHNHKLALTKYYYSNRQQLNTAINESLVAQEMWRVVPFDERANIWRKCADIIEKEDRYILNAAIMLGQGKTYRQAEEDTCRLIEALRMNVDFLQQLSQIKLKSDAPDLIYPSFHMRPLDGFVAAIGPFNQTSVSANLAFCPALMGNCVLWKPSNYCILSSYIVFQAMMKAGLPGGIISFMPSNPRLFFDVISTSPHMAGINFTGSVAIFRHIWHEMSTRLQLYNTLPRLVGECGGKSFHFVHESADLELVVEATMRAAFEYSGQNCNSCCRLYVPKSMWPDLGCALDQEIAELKVGDPCDFSAFTSAVISEESYQTIVKYIQYAQKSPTVKIISGGDFCKTLGFFVEPTVLLCEDPMDRLLTEEIMGPLLSVYVYKNDAMNQVLELIANTSKFAFSGSIFATKDDIICHVLQKLRMAASNIYINEKCTGSLVGQMPFGGNRLSGTNDKTGSAYFLLRWCSPQLVEETFPSGPPDCAQRI